MYAKFVCDGESVCVRALVFARVRIIARERGLGKAKGAMPRTRGHKAKTVTGGLKARPCSGAHADFIFADIVSL